MTNSAATVPGSPEQAEREEILGFLLGFARAYQDRLADRVARLNLTVPQARVLYFVESAPTVRRLADRLRCDASYVTGIIDRLENLRLLRRQVDPEDRRVKHLVLTAAGRRTRDRVVRVMSEASELDGLGPEETRQLGGLLRKMGDSGALASIW